MFTFFSPHTGAYQIHQFDSKTKKHFSLGIAYLMSMLNERESKCLMKTFAVYIFSRFAILLSLTESVI